MKSFISLIAGIFAVITGSLLIGSKVGLLFTVCVVLTMMFGIIAWALGNRAWRNKQLLGLIGAMLGIIGWIEMLAVVITTFVL